MKLKEKEICVQCIQSAIKSDRGNLFFKNIAADIRARKTLHPKIGEFFAQLSSKLLSPAANQGSLQTISEIAGKAEFQLAGPTTKTRFGALTTTTTFETLRKYYLDLAKTPIPNSLTDQEAAEFVGDKNIHHLLDLGAEFRGSKPVVWLAPLHDILSDFKGSLPDADDLRSYLGLSHFVEDQVLVNISFRPELTRSYEIRRPTAFDGGPNLVFRTDTSRRRHGYTINLVGLGNGAREVVAPPVSTREVNNCTLVGAVRTMPSIDWNDIADSCVGDINLVIDFIG